MVTSKSSEPKKKAVPQDWHRADIVAAIRKAGWSLRRLAKHHGYAAATTLTHALDRPWPKGERIIADAIGVSAAEIWPSRYQLKDTTETLSNHSKPQKSMPDTSHAACDDSTSERASH